MLPLVGCGFRPVHGRRADGASVAALMSGINIDPISDREGQVLRLHLLQRLTPRGAPPDPIYRLSVRLDEQERTVAVREDNSATRSNLVLRADFVLSDTRSGRALTTGNERISTSYDIQSTTQGQFTTITARRDARARGLEALADLIQRRLSLFLSRQGAG